MKNTRLCDLRFFTECIDPAVPALASLPALAEEGRMEEATRLFTAHVRQTLRPDIYLRTDKERLEADRESICADAERVFAHTFISCRTPHTFGKVIDWEHNPTYNGYCEWPWQLNRHAEWILLARYFLLTGDQRAAAEWEEQFLSWAIQAQVPENESPYATICWRTIEAGIRMQVWAYVFHAFLPAVSDETILVFCKSIWEHGWRLRNFNTKYNWLIMEMHGLTRIGLVYPFFRDSTPWLQYALKRLQEEFDVQVYPDGMQNELTMGYHSVVVHNYTDVLDLYRRMELPAPVFLEKGLAALNDIYAKTAAPDLKTPACNDSGRLSVPRELRSALSVYPDNEVYRYFATERMEGEEPSYRSLYLEYSGIAIFRSGWEPDAYWAYMDMSPFGAGHQHEDKLNVTIFALGREMLQEAGVFDYDTSEMRKYVLSTRSHNTARIDGMNQNCRARYRWHPEDIRRPCEGNLFLSTPERDTARSVYEDGYGPDLLAVTHTRTFLFCKEEQGLPPFFVSIDRFAAPDDAVHRFELLWHLQDTPVLFSGNTVTCQWEDGTRFTAASSAGGISVIRGQKTPEFQGWFPKLGVGDVEHFAIPTISQTGLFTGSVRVVTVLYPAAPGQIGIVSAEASPDPAETAFTLHLSDGRTITVEE